MLENLENIINEAKLVKEAAFKSAEFLLQEKLASEQKNNYLNLLFESDENDEIEEEDEVTLDENDKDLSDDKSSEEKDSESVKEKAKKYSKPKLAPTEKDKKTLITDEVDPTEADIFESIRSLYDDDEEEEEEGGEEDNDNEDCSLKESSSAKKPLLNEADEQTEDQDVEVNDDDEELEFDFDDAEGAPQEEVAGPPMAEPPEDPSDDSEKPSNGIADNPDEPEEDLEQIKVEDFPFSYDRKNVLDEKNTNKKSKIKLRPQYEKDSPTNPNNTINPPEELEELEESDEPDENEENLDYGELEEVDQDQLDEETVKVPSNLLLEYMEKDLIQESTIERLRKENNALRVKLEKKDSTISKYAKQLEDSNRFLAEGIKVQYKFKAMSDVSLNERQKRVICEQIDKHSDVDTIGKVYETVRDSAGVARAKESLSDIGNRTSKTTIFLKESKKHVESESSIHSERLRKLAGIE